jgi:hypothetical protein
METINSDKDFFYNLPLMDGFMDLWHIVKDTDPIFLTGLPGSNAGKEAKKRWVDKHFTGTEVIVVPKKDKRAYAAPNHILIDDRADTIIQWRAEKGIGIHHEENNFHNTIFQLRNILKTEFNWSK